MGPGLYATAEHVVARASEIVLTGQDGRAHRAEVVATSTTVLDKHRAVLLRASDPLPGACVPRLDDDPGRTLGRIVGYGFQQGDFQEGGLPFDGRVVGESRVERAGAPLLRVATPFRLGHGQSGAPALDPATGLIVGMVVTGANASAHLFPVHALRSLSAEVTGHQSDAATLRWWRSRLSDAQIRASGDRFATRELRSLARTVARRGAAHPFAPLSSGRPVPRLSDVYEAQDLLLWDESSDFAGTRTATLRQLLLAPGSHLIIAPPGGGKSSALRIAGVWASTLLQEEDTRLVVMPVEATDLVSRQPIEAVLSAALRALPSAVDGGYEQRLFKRDPVPETPWTLLVDGLDEVVDPRARADVLERLGELARPSDGGKEGRARHRVIVMSRPLADHDLASLAGTLGAVWKIPPLSPASRTSLFRKWFPGAIAEDQVARLHRLEHQGSDELLGSPLLLTMAAQLLVAAPDADLPLSRTALLQAYFDALRQRYFTGASSPISQVEALAALYGEESRRDAARFAASIYEELGRLALEDLHSASTEDLHDFARSLPAVSRLPSVEWEPVGRALLGRTGVVDVEQAGFRFAHRLVAEFMAAWICSQDARVASTALERALSEDPPVLLSNHSFVRFAAPSWRTDRRFAGWLSDRLERGDVGALDLAVALVMDDPDHTGEVRADALAAARRAAADVTREDDLWRVAAARVGLGDPGLVADLCALASRTDAPAGVRIWALLASVTAVRPGIRVPGQRDALWTDEKRHIVQTLVSNGPPVTGRTIRLLAADPRISVFDREELVTALVSVGDVSGVDLRRSSVEEALRRLVMRVHERHPTAELSIIETAYARAARPYAAGPGTGDLDSRLAVATVLADLGMSPTTVAAALLHGSLDDAAWSVEQLRQEFGEEITRLVAGLTTLDRATYRGSDDPRRSQRVVVGIARDIRVLVVAIAERLHEARTRRSAPGLSDEARARENLEVYGPLACTLGFDDVQQELDDLAFATLYPRVHEEIVDLVESRVPGRQALLEAVRDQVTADLRAVRITPVVSGRVKHYYEIYRQMIVDGRDFAELYDLVRIRVLVDSVRDCYAALGALHARWNPVPGRFKDYIAMPTFAMYQSLHTTVIGPGGKPVEIQIRTHEMHRRAEYGPASHRMAADGRGQDAPATSRRDLGWMRQLADWAYDSQHQGELLDSLRLEVQSSEIFVLTPGGDVVELPTGSTPVDLAYAVHTEIGHRTVSARVNGADAPLDRELVNGDVVEVLSATGATPSAAWLRTVRTRRASRQIRRKLRQPDSGPET